MTCMLNFLLVSSLNFVVRPQRPGKNRGTVILSLLHLLDGNLHISFKKSCLLFPHSAMVSIQHQRSNSKMNQSILSSFPTRLTNPSKSSLKIHPRSQYSKVNESFPPPITPIATLSLSLLNVRSKPHETDFQFNILKIYNFLHETINVLRCCNLSLHVPHEINLTSKGPISKSSQESETHPRELETKEHLFGNTIERIR